MRTLDQWFAEYSVSHQNKTNKLIHYLCVPAIFFSIVGLLYSIPPGILTKLLPVEVSLLENWAFIALLVVLVFYFRLSLAMGMKVLVFSGLCIVGNYLIDMVASLWLVSLLIFAVAWAGQFYGHKLEGKKPSFFKDLQFLLIGPAWVIENLFKKA